VTKDPRESLHLKDLQLLHRTFSLGLPRSLLEKYECSVSGVRDSLITDDPTSDTSVDMDKQSRNVGSNSVRVLSNLSLSSIPLAERMRPTSVADYVGQGQIVGSNKPLRTLIETNRISSMIFWGPPGCGKVCAMNVQCYPIMPIKTFC
jgi:hypothetical protein